MRKRKQLSFEMDFSPISNYIEKGTEISKETLVRRCAGHLEYSYFRLIKLLQFWGVGKDENGQVYVY